MAVSLCLYSRSLQDLLRPFLLACNHSDASPHLIIMAMGSMQYLINRDAILPSDAPNILRCVLNTHHTRNEFCTSSRHTLSTHAINQNKLTYVTCGIKKNISENLKICPRFPCVIPRYPCDYCLQCRGNIPFFVLGARVSGCRRLILAPRGVWFVVKSHAIVSEMLCHMQNTSWKLRRRPSLLPLSLMQTVQ